MKWWVIKALILHMFEAKLSRSHSQENPLFPPTYIDVQRVQWVGSYSFVFKGKVDLMILLSYCTQRRHGHAVLMSLCRFPGNFQPFTPPRNRHIPSSITSEEWNEFHVHRWVMTFYGKWIEVGACPFCSLYIPSPAWPSNAHIKVHNSSQG